MGREKKQKEERDERNLLERKAEASLLGLVGALGVEAEESGSGGGGGGGIVVAGASLLWALIAADDDDDDAESSVSTRISVLETLAFFLWPHCSNMSPLTPPAPRPGQGLALAQGLGLLSRFGFWVWWFFAADGGSWSCWWWWWLSDWGEVGAASKVLIWSWVVLDGDLNLKPLASKVEQLVPFTFVLVVLVVGLRILPLMLGFFPLLKATPSGLLTL